MLGSIEYGRLLIEFECVIEWMMLFDLLVRWKNKNLQLMFHIFHAFFYTASITLATDHTLSEFNYTCIEELSYRLIEVQLKKVILLAPDHSILTRSSQIKVRPCYCTNKIKKGVLSETWERMVQNFEKDCHRILRYISPKFWKKLYLNYETHYSRAQRNYLESLERFSRVLQGIL